MHLTAYVCSLQFVLYAWSAMWGNKLSMFFPFSCPMYLDWNTNFLSWLSGLNKTPCLFSTHTSEPSMGDSCDLKWIWITLIFVKWKFLAKFEVSGHLEDQRPKAIRHEMNNLMVGISRQHYNRGHLLDAKATREMEKKWELGKKGIVAEDWGLGRKSPQRLEDEGEFESVCEEHGLSLSQQQLQKIKLVCLNTQNLQRKVYSSDLYKFLGINRKPSLSIFPFWFPG